MTSQMKYQECLESVCLTNSPPKRAASASPHLKLPSPVTSFKHYSRRAATIFLMHSSLSIALLLSSFVYGAALTGIRNHWSDPYSLRPNPLYPYPRFPTIRSPKNISTSAPRFSKSLNTTPSRTWGSKFRAGAALQPRQDPSTTTEQDLDTRPTPEPTGEPSIETTIFITDKNEFALLLPAIPGGMFEFILTTDVRPRPNPHYRTGIRRRKQCKSFLYS